MTVHATPASDATCREVREIGVDGTLGLPGTDVAVAAAAILRPAR